MGYGRSWQRIEGDGGDEDDTAWLRREVDDAAGVGASCSVAIVWPSTAKVKSPPFTVRS